MSTYGAEGEVYDRELTVLVTHSQQFVHKPARSFAQTRQPLRAQGCGQSRYGEA